MLHKPQRILIITSVSPSKDGPGKLSLNAFNALKKEGYSVDLLTKYSVKDYPDILYIYKKKNIFNLLREKIISFCIRKQKKGYYFFYKKEIYPPVPINDVLKAITNSYDLVFIQFWQGLLTFETIKAIHDKLHCQIHFAGVDYSQMSGGCHFTGDCNRYKIGCGKCPAFNSNDKNDFTHWNVLYRKQIYEEVKPIVYGNTYMQKFYNDSYLLKNVRKSTSSMLIDTNTFSPTDKAIAKSNFNIPSNKFVILFGCQHLDDKRKGIKYLIESLVLFHDKLTVKEQENILVATIGDNYNQLKDKIPFDTLNLGFVTFNKLPLIYSLADIFLCSSINDAGPMMVNQSLCCGTPVVAFEMGTALDCIKGHNTGYCAKLKDSNDFTNGIYTIYKMNNTEKEKLCLNCREFALENYTERAWVNRIISTYNKYL